MKMVNVYRPADQTAADSPYNYRPPVSGVTVTVGGVPAGSGITLTVGGVPLPMGWRYQGGGAYSPNRIGGTPAGPVVNGVLVATPPPTPPPQDPRAAAILAAQQRPGYTQSPGDTRTAQLAAVIQQKNPGMSEEASRRLALEQQRQDASKTPT